MAKQRAAVSGKGKGPFRLWVEENQKVVMVVLLIIIAPLFAFTGPVTNFFGREDPVLEEFYGEPIRRSKFTATMDLLGTALSICQGANFQSMMSDPSSSPPAPAFQADSLLAGGGGDQAEGMEILRFFLYREKARRMELRVTDRELSDHIRDLWQWMEASRRAGEEFAARRAAEKEKKKSEAEEWQAQREMHEIARQKKKEFESTNAFDPDTWAEYVKRYGRSRSGREPRLREFEETLRDLYLIAKLESHIRKGVQVTPEEVYEKFRTENRSRLFSWTEFHADETLKGKVAAALKPEELKAHYDANREELEKPVSIRAAWLLVPKAHYLEQAEKAVTEDDVRKHYADNKNDYRKPTISASEATFSVRTKEETEQHDASLYKPFDEVRDEVRKQAIDRRADADMRAFSQQLRTRLFPSSAATPAPAPAPPSAALLEGTAKEFPFLVQGTSGWATSDDAEEVFGKGFSRQVTNWLAQAGASRPGQKPDLNAPSIGTESEAGLVYYSKPEVRNPMLPPLDDIRDEVQKAAVTSRAVGLIEKAAVAAAAEIDGGKKTLEQVAEAGLEVEVGPAGSAEKVVVKGTPVRKTPRHLGRYDSVMIPKEKKDEEKKDSAPKAEGDPEEPEEEVHPSSRRIIDAVSRISEKGKTAVAADEENAACHIVRLDDFIHPDAAKFEERRAGIEAQLRREKEGQRLAQWRAEVQAEARGESPVEGAPPVEQPPVSP